MRYVILGAAVGLFVGTIGTDIAMRIFTPRLVVKRHRM